MKTIELLNKQKELYQTNQLDENKIPKHIAIIMDGNGRWAKKRFLPRIAGHKAGSEALRRAIKACTELGISYLSVYAFSTENWSRPEQEVSFLMNFFKELIEREIPELKKQGARVRCLGNISALNFELQEKIAWAENQTINNNLININIMINYGSREEIASACRKIAQDYANQQISEINENLFTQYLYTKDIPELDILIRTGGDFRLSNFLLWQAAYTELFFLDTLWPDFDQEVLIKVIKGFQNRDRRFGGLN